MSKQSDEIEGLLYKALTDSTPHLRRAITLAVQARRQDIATNIGDQLDRALEAIRLVRTIKERQQQETMQ